MNVMPNLIGLKKTIMDCHREGKQANTLVLHGKYFPDRNTTDSFPMTNSVGSSSEINDKFTEVSKN